MRRGVSTLLLAGAGLAVLASASIAAGPARTPRTARPTRTTAGKTFTLVTSPKCDTNETLVGNACYHNVQGSHLTFTFVIPADRDAEETAAILRSELEAVKRLCER